MYLTGEAKALRIFLGLSSCQAGAFNSGCWFVLAAQQDQA